MQPSERVRRQWLAFEQWVALQRGAMEKQLLENFQDMDVKWNATRNRSTKQDHDKTKAAYRRELKDGLVTLAREDWQRRLQEAGLKDEDWGEMTMTETRAVENLLGGNSEEEAIVILESVARADETVVGAFSGVPALTNETRTTNSSGYSFVSPMSLSILDDDESYESIFADEILPSSGPESVVDEIFDAPTSIPWGWNGDASSFGIWSANTSQSSRQSSQTGSPERPAPKTIPADHAFFPRVAEPLSHFQPESTSTHRSRGPRYIGPQLTDNDEVFDDEAEFERFKMETRVTKIREFHEEAAQADIQLAQDIYNARKTSMTSGDEERKISEHEKRMVELRRLKEEERKLIVKTRNARPAITSESDRLTVSVPDLLEGSSTPALPTACSTPVSLTSTSTSSSSQNPTARWIPPPESGRRQRRRRGRKRARLRLWIPQLRSSLASPTRSCQKARSFHECQLIEGESAFPPTSKGPSPVTAGVSASSSKTKAPSPPILSPAAAPTFFSPPPPAATNKPMVSTASANLSKAANANSTKAKAPSPPTSKGLSPPVASTAETPKPTAPPVVLPQKTARVMEIQTPGASSSRTTLEQMQRPFIHKSLGSDAWIGAPPPPAAPGSSVWVSSTSAQIEKSTSIPVRLPALAETIRPRRMSDPISPSPRIFALPDDLQDAKQGADALPSITKKGKGKQAAKPKRVTVEEVSDEEDADTLERLPVDSKYIFEPKPSVPPTMFSQIIDFTPTPPPGRPASPSTTIRSDGSSRSSNPPLPKRAVVSRTATGSLRMRNTLDGRPALPAM
ncbi:hypothetical protein K438DRAFT_1763427 [Mycena galopus ATCC 62051]|nr:hypothetical protein K438DRAFT_1763427 [Mycena galopus ATCC 62051]